MRKRIDRDKIITAFLASSFEKSAGATSLSDIAARLGVNKASLYNHFSSRDEMYGATLDFCSSYLAKVEFLPKENNEKLKMKNEKILQRTHIGPDERHLSGNTEGLSPDVVLKEIVSLYVRSYEIEPLISMYSFIHSEQYFNDKAAATAADEMRKITDGCALLFRQFITGGEFRLLNDGEIADAAETVAAVIASFLNGYITQKKLTMRVNPETGTGSLFALPTDEDALQKVNGVIAASIASLKKY